MKNGNMLKYKTTFLATCLSALLATTASVYAGDFPACPNFIDASNSFYTLPNWLAATAPVNYNLYQTPATSSGNINSVYSYFVERQNGIDTLAKAILRIRWMSGFLSNAGSVEYLAHDIEYKQCLYYGKMAEDGTPDTPQILSLQYSQPHVLPILPILPILPSVTVTGTSLSIPSTVLKGAQYQVIYTLKNPNQSTLTYRLIKNALAEVTFLQPVFNACDTSGNPARLAARQSCNMQMEFNTALLPVGLYEQSILSIGSGNTTATAPILKINTTILANTFHNFIVFGDSLSDNGDNGGPYTNPADAEHGGKYNWVQDVARNGLFPSKDLIASKNLGTLDPVNTNLDFGYGGATTNELAGQISSYKETVLKGAKPDPNTVVFIWMGGNDYLQSPGYLPHIKDIASNMMGAINTLHEQLGIAFDHIYILNLTDLSQIPMLKNITTPQQKALIAQSILAYNSLLAADIQAQTPDVHVLDIHSFAETIVLDPQVYAMDPALLSEQCLGTTGEPNCISYLSWDGIHPTTTTHQEIANYVASHLND